MNPPYFIRPKINDATHKVGVSQIEKPMPLSDRRKSKKLSITDTKDDAVNINKPTSLLQCDHNDDNALGHGEFSQDKKT